MNRHRNTNLVVFIQYEHTRTILRNKECVFKKNSKFQNFDEIFYCGMTKQKQPKFQNFDEIFYCDMTRLANTNLGVFMQCQYTRTILRKKNMGQSLIK